MKASAGALRGSARCARRRSARRRASGDRTIAFWHTALRIISMDGIDMCLPLRKRLPPRAGGMRGVRGRERWAGAGKIRAAKTAEGAAPRTAAPTKQKTAESAEVPPQCFPKCS